MVIEVGDKVLETDDEGYIVDLEAWTPAVAEKMAADDDCQLTDNHWAVINFLRSYYQEYRIEPRVRILVREMGKTLGPDKGNSRFLYELFPYGPAKQACRYAGLPKPTNCF
ncbi:MAG: TusE/DsrC/DsvC family sulfur relay protein [Acidiferrobacterales bacterium]